MNHGQQTLIITVSPTLNWYPCLVKAWYTALGGGILRSLVSSSGGATCRITGSNS